MRGGLGGALGLGEWGLQAASGDAGKQVYMMVCVGGGRGG